MTRFTHHLHSATAFTALVTLALVPMWWKHPLAPPPFTTAYVTGFVIFIPALLTLALWLRSGFDGWQHLWADRPRRLWAIVMLAGTAWGLLSSGWAFVSASRPGVTLGAALQFALAITFALAVMAVQIPVRRVLWLLTVVVLVHALVGGAQVIAQRDVGLSALGEFDLNPETRGVSVIQSGEVRWLRPYGLTSHPNIYAGFLLVSAFAAGTLALTASGWRAFCAAAVFALALWLLFMTFSRSAWLGFIAGGLVFVLLNRRALLREVVTRRRVAGLFATAIVLGVVFVVAFRPLLFARVGVGAESTEVRSIADRVVYNNVAVVAIREHPVLGVGAGNFPWYAAHYLFHVAESEYRGDYVHNIYLIVQSEFGIVGSVVFGSAVIGALGVSVRRLHQQPSIERAALLCGVIGLLVVGLFDHYPWTLFPSQILLWTLLGLSLPPAASQNRY